MTYVYLPRKADSIFVATHGDTTEWVNVASWPSAPPAAATHRDCAALWIAVGTLAMLLLGLELRRTGQRKRMLGNMLQSAELMGQVRAKVDAHDAMIRGLEAADRGHASARGMDELAAAIGYERETTQAQTRWVKRRPR